MSHTLDVRTSPVMSHTLDVRTSPVMSHTLDVRTSPVMFTPRYEDNAIHKTRLYLE